MSSEFNMMTDGIFVILSKATSGTLLAINTGDTVVGIKYRIWIEG